MVKGIYRILGDAEIVNRGDNAVYAASAIRADDMPDEYGIVPAWELIWYIPNVDNPEEAIDWDVPDEINPYGGEHNQGGYQITTGRII